MPPPLPGRRSRIPVIAIVLIALGLILTFRLTWLTRDEPWFISVLKIDGPAYIDGMKSIAASRDFVNLDDIYHSAGYQMYIGAIDVLYPFDRGVFFGIKLLSGLLFAATIVLTVRIGERHFARGAGWIAGAILALSLDWQVYANLLQGEVLQGFCFALFTGTMIRIAETGSRRLLLAASLLAAFLTLLQVRYFPLVPLAALALLLRARGSGRANVRGTSRANARGISRANARAAVLFLVPCLLILGAWSWYHSVREERTIFVAKGSEFRMRNAYNPNATGASFPYPDIAEPTGFRFVMSDPGRVAWLLKERFLYLWNWKRDIWDLGNPVTMHARQKIVSTPFEIPLHVAGTILFAAGVRLRLRQVGRGSRAGTGDAGGATSDADKWLLVWVLAVITGPMLVFASSRFLIPALPAIALFQASALLAIGSRARRRSDRPG